MAPGGDGVTAAQVLSPRSLARHLAEIEKDDLEYAGSIYGSQPGAGGQEGPVTPPPGGRKTVAQYGVSRCYLRTLWLSLAFAVLLLCGVTVMQVLLQQERAKEQRESLRQSSGASVNSDSAVKMAHAAQEKAQALSVALDAVKQQQADMAATLASVQEAADARFQAACEALLAGEEEAAGPTVRTDYVCQTQTGWALACPGGGAPTLVQALVGRFVAGPDSPCAEGRPAAQLAVCPASVDVTAATRAALAAAGGGPVAATPLQLLGARADPCPRSYKQLQLTYQCPAPDAGARAARCKQALAAAAATAAAPAGGAAVPTGGAGPAAPLPGAAAGTSPQV